ncbi:ABC transporter permease [Ulvibacterium sp.]|uniref:ABC transporter permease n=1 Tax=Ulvibacterium sp. TaxID=2665914 RepID=UPI003BAAD2EF
MFRNYLKIAWRNLKTNKLFSAINILGLSIGLSITLLLFLFISNEFSFDSMYPKKDRIYRVLTKTDTQFDNEVWATSAPVMASALKENVTNVETAARVYKNDFGKTASVRANEQNFTEPMFYWVDKELLSIFDIRLVKGDAKSALDRPNTVILSESAAKKYFNDQDPIGKTILVDNRRALEVTGVYVDFPNNSTLDANVLASSNGHWFYDRKTWSSASFETYCLLKKKATVEATVAQMGKLLDDNVEKEDQWYSLSLQPLSEVHLYSASLGNSFASRIGDINEVRNLGYLAILILLIACMNYMNLTTARSQKRSKEVGINKTLGALSQSLVLRFYLETALLTAISILLGVVLTILVLPGFNALTNQNLSWHLLMSGPFVAAILGIWLVTTLVSGIYPSLYLSKFLPREVLSPSLKHEKGNAFVRKGLVVLQFAASAALIVGVLVIYQQTRFIQNKNLGFDSDNIMVISTKGMRAENRTTMTQEFKNKAEVSNVAMAQGYPGIRVSGYSLFKNASYIKGLGIQANVSDATITDVLQMKFLAGQGLPMHKTEGDTLVEVVLNKKAVDYLGFSPEEAIGQQAIIFHNRPAIIVGVVDDFNFASLHEPIGAYAFHNNVRNEGKSYMLVRFNTKDLQKTLSDFKTTFAKVAPNLDFNYSFLDQNLEQLYIREKRAANVSIAFCLLAIFVAAMGLFGLAAFTAEQRKKEVGIRKVLGASVLGIAQMLSKDFLKLVLVALVIAFPLAYWVMSSWLEGFAFHIDIGWAVFAIAGILAIAIALFTVSFQAIGAAMANPVKSLRTE